jgi:hypothetical protein
MQMEEVFVTPAVSLAAGFGPFAHPHAADLADVA